MEKKKQNGSYCSVQLGVEGLRREFAREHVEQYWENTGGESQTVVKMLLGNYFSETKICSGNYPGRRGGVVVLYRKDCSAMVSVRIS